jgi:integrase
MATKNHITQAFCKSIAWPESGRVVCRDDRLPGFAVEVSANETITFYRIGRILGDMTRFKIGNYPALTADDARKACTAINGQIAMGIDPRESRKKKVATVAVTEFDTKIMGGLFDWYFKFESKPNKKRWLADQNCWVRVFQARQWHALPVADIKRHMIQQLQAELLESSGAMAANEAVTLLRNMFTCANLNEFFPGNPAATINQFPRRQRERFLTADELQRFFTALAKRPQDYRDMFLLSLLTGARRSNVMAARWDQIDFAACAWSIPDTASKKKNFIRLPLSGPSMAILESRKGNDSPWIFPSRGAKRNSKSGHLEEPKHHFQQVIKDAGLQDVRLHDLRHFFASIQANDGISLAIIGASLGHKPGSTATARYAHLTDSSVRASIESAGQKIIESIPKNNSEKS